MREWLSGGVSPCQGEGRGFESRLALSGKQDRVSCFYFCVTGISDQTKKRFAQDPAAAEWKRIANAARRRGRRAAKTGLCAVQSAPVSVRICAV